MRAVRISAPAVNNVRPARSGPGAPPSGRRPGGRRTPKKDRPVPGTRLRGLRWVPAPLALLAVVLGLLVMGSLQGQAAADLASHPNQAGGLSLTVDTMLWMSNDVSGSGAPASANVPGQAAPPPADSTADGSDGSTGFSMPDSMMPGYQPTGDDRLRIEIDLNNVTGRVQQYSMTDFTVSDPSGKIYQVNGQEHSDQPASADLQPGFATTIDMYWDIPSSDAKNLTLHWARGGRTISMPVNTGGEAPAGMHM
jgi:hypothetical protein